MWNFNSHLNSQYFLLQVRVTITFNGNYSHLHCYSLHCTNWTCDLATLPWKLSIHGSVIMTTPIINFDITCKGNRRVQSMRACINQPKSKTTKRCAQVVCLVHFIASTRYITRKTYNVKLLVYTFIFLVPNVSPNAITVKYV